MKCDWYLIRVVLQRAVVTMVADTVSVCVSLVHVVNIRAIVVFIQNACSEFERRPQFSRLHKRFGDSCK